MPTNPNQSPWPGQKHPISTERVVSNIPKDGIDGSWTYPSPQMFYNALKRKGKDDNVEEKDMATVVAIHNNMNENTWREILKWERLHSAECDCPKLSRFFGRVGATGLDLNRLSAWGGALIAHDHSPLARLKMLFGYPAPFDRHDWVLNRCGREVRYVIDYYHDETVSSHDRMPTSLADAHSVQSISFVVRPALDSVEALVDRVRMFTASIVAGSQKEVALPPEGLGRKPTAATATKTMTSETNSSLVREVGDKCGKAFHAWQACVKEGGGEGDACSQQHLAMEFCMAKASTGPPMLLVA
eukprot:scaffold3826_cov407-Prasinococcus_capsulatus_cf.AAC.2